MQVTEHNVAEWELTKNEIKDLIQLVKTELKKYEDDKMMQTYYGIILGKLLIMKFSEDS